MCDLLVAGVIVGAVALSGPGCGYDGCNSYPSYSAPCVQSCGTERYYYSGYHIKAVPVPTFSYPGYPRPVHGPYFGPRSQGRDHRGETRPALLPGAR